MTPTPAGPRHFLSLTDLSAEETRGLLRRATELKQWLAAGVGYAPLTHKVMGMVFEKASTRTRVSFEAGMAQFGGHAIFLSPRDTQLGRGEPVADSARVLSRMVDVVMIRTFAHAIVEEFAAHSRVPVINALTDYLHPCQLLADMETWWEHRGDIRGRTVAWVGDGNNMCQSYLEAAPLFDFQLRIACPEGFDPDPGLLAAAGDRCVLLRDPRAAVAGADLVVTDVWTSMGQEAEREERLKRFESFQVNGKLLELAAPGCRVLHCLPAHRGEEITDDVMDGPAAAVFPQAENRLHTQKAVLEWLLK